jgi:secreted PhoX family phosphatase
VGEEIRPPRLHPYGGTVWALDVADGALWGVPEMGRGAWENVTPLDTGDGGRVAVLLADDTALAPLYLYIGSKRDGGFLERNGFADGQVFVFRADDGRTTAETFNGNGSRLAGHFVPIEIFGPGVCQRSDIRCDPAGYVDAPSQFTMAEEVGAFRFSRPEDLATDPANPRRAVLASTGGSAVRADRWGTLYLIDVDFDSDGLPATITILIDSDANQPSPDHGLRNPDNLDWADDGVIYVQEDPSHGDFGSDSGQEASIWRVDAESGAADRIAMIDRKASLPDGMRDFKAGKFGAWETSGVLDVTDLFETAPGEILLVGTVQAHGVTGGAIDDFDLVEGGQLYFLSTRAR